MSKKNNTNKAQASNNIAGVAPVENTDETIDNGVLKEDVESPKNLDLSVNEPSEVESNEADNSSSEKTDVVENIVEVFELADKAVVENDATLPEGNHYVTIVTVSANTDVIEKRLDSAGFKPIIDGFSVGPFKTEAEAISAKKKITGKGLRCKIVKK